MVINIWHDFLGDIEVPDDYKKKKYKHLSGFEKQRGNNLIRYEDILFLQEIKPILMLRQSLLMDGRFYGAEWVEKPIEYPWMECKKCGGYLRTEEQMILHSEQNLGHDSFENVKGGVMGMTYGNPYIEGSRPLHCKLDF